MHYAPKYKSIFDDDKVSRAPIEGAPTPAPVENLSPPRMIVDSPLDPSPTSLPTEATPSSPQSLPQCNYIYPACLPITGKIYTNQTGQFTIPSSSSMNYLFVLYEHDFNYIHAVVIQSCTKSQLLQAYKSGIGMFKSSGFIPKMKRLDNEASELLQEYMDSEKIDCQLTPAGIHRRNLAERAIQTLKDHLIAGLCSCDPSSPLHLWDKLISQGLLTLNLMRPSHACPQISAYAHVHGAFDYNRTPIAPPGIKVLAHLRPEDRPLWSLHAVEGYYVGPQHLVTLHRLYANIPNTPLVPAPLPNAIRNPY